MQGDIPAIFVALQDGQLGTFMRVSLFAYPLTATLHILGFTVLVGGMAMVDLRLLGVLRRVDAAELHRQVRPWAIGAFAVTAVTGFLMFAADAAHVIGNPAFGAKAILIALAGLNAFVFHVGPERLHKAGAALSLLFWAGVIVAGRMIAYL